MANIEAKPGTDCIAKRMYEATRGSVAYNLPPLAQAALVRRHGNQHATVYVFNDGSEFVQYADFYKRGWRGQDKRIGGCYVDGGVSRQRQAGVAL